jgi:hypothetical protein
MNNFIVKPNKTVAELIQYKEQCRINKINEEDMKKNPHKYFRFPVDDAWMPPYHFIKQNEVPTPTESEYKEYLSFIDQ